MPAACWPNEPHYRLFVFPRVRVRALVFVFNFGSVCSQVAGSQHRVQDGCTNNFRTRLAHCSSKPSMQPAAPTATAHSTCAQWSRLACKFAEIKSAFNGDFNSFNSPINALIAPRQILLLFLLKIEYISLSLSLSLSVCLFHACRLFKNKFQFPFLLPFAWQFVYVLCIHMSLSLSLCLSPYQRVCFCRCYGNQYLNSVRSFSPCCVRLSPWTFKNKIQTHSTRSTTQ